MLESGYHVSARDPVTDTGQDQVSLQDVFWFLKRAAGVVALTTSLSAGAGALYLMITPRSFVARTQLLIEPQKFQPSTVQETGVLDLTISSSQVESQVEVLRSNRIALSVIEKLRLDNDPEFSGADPNTSSFERTYTALGELSKRLDIRRVGQSYVVQVTSRSQDQEKAAAIANAVADAYLQDQLDWKIAGARRGREWLEARIQDIKDQLYASARAIQDFRTGKNAQAASNNEIDAEVTLAALESAVSTYREMYKDMLQRLVEATQNEASPSPDARIIVAAAKPLAPLYPSKKLTMAFSILGGALLGLGVAAVRSATDRSLRSPRQVQRQLDVPCLGILPRMPARQRKRLHGPEVVLSPGSFFSRALRAVKTSVDLKRVKRNIQLIGVSPVLPGNGATTVARNLAALFSASGTKTLLVTVDRQHKPALETKDRQVDTVGAGGQKRRSQGVGAQKSDLLQVVLPLAQGTPAADQSDPFMSDQVRSLLAQARRSFPTIVVDLPPLLTAPEALALSQHLDAVVVVAEYGKTPLELAARATGLLHDLDVEVLGVVMNKAVGAPRMVLAST